MGRIDIYLETSFLAIVYKKFFRHRVTPCVVQRPTNIKKQRQLKTGLIGDNTHSSIVRQGIFFKAKDRDPKGDSIKNLARLIAPASAGAFFVNSSYSRVAIPKFSITRSLTLHSTSIECDQPAAPRYLTRAGSRHSLANQLAPYVGERVRGLLPYLPAALS